MAYAKVYRFHELIKQHPSSVDFAMQEVHNLMMSVLDLEYVASQVIDISRFGLQVDGYYVDPSHEWVAFNNLSTFPRRSLHKNTATDQLKDEMLSGDWHFLLQLQYFYNSVMKQKKGISLKDANSNLIVDKIKKGVYKLKFYNHWDDKVGLRTMCQIVLSNHTQELTEHSVYEIEEIRHGIDEFLLMLQDRVREEIWNLKERLFSEDILSPLLAACYFTAQGVCITMSPKLTDDDLLEIVNDKPSDQILTELRIAKQKPIEILLARYRNKYGFNKNIPDDVLMELITRDNIDLLSDIREQQRIKRREKRMRIRDTIKRGWTMAEQATSKHMRNKIVKEVFAQQAYEELLKQKTFSEHNKDKVAKFIEVEQKELLLGKKEALQDKDTKKSNKK